MSFFSSLEVYVARLRPLRELMASPQNCRSTDTSACAPWTACCPHGTQDAGGGDVLVALVARAEAGHPPLSWLKFLLCPLLLVLLLGPRAPPRRLGTL